MPNWSFNNLSITGKKEELIRFLQEGLYGYKPVYALSDLEKKFGLKGEDGTKLVPTMNKLLPVPQEILDQGYSDAGYNWQVNNWGTKWDFCDLDDNETEEELEDIESNEIMTLTYSYCTAWAPNSEWVFKAAQSFPALIFEFSYEEESGAFAGRNIFKNGREIVAHDYRDMVVYNLMETGRFLEDIVGDRYDCYYEEEFEDILKYILDDFKAAILLGLTTEEKVTQIVTKIWNESDEEVA